MLGKITNSTKAFVDKLDTAKQRNLLSILFVLIVLPLLIISSQQFQNLIQRASPNGTIQITLDGKEIANGQAITKTFVKLKATQPTGWQIIASKSLEKQYSLVPVAHAQSCSDYVVPNNSQACNQPAYDTCFPTYCENGLRYVECAASQAPTTCTGKLRCGSQDYLCITPTPTQRPDPTIQQSTPTPSCSRLITISGSVYNQNGQGISGVKVCLDPGTSNCDTFFGTTGNTGTYVINNVVPGGSGHNVYLDPSTLRNATVTSQNPITSNICRNDTKNFTVQTTNDQTLQPTATTAPTASPTTSQGTALPTATPTPFIHNLQAVIIENIDGGSQGSPKQQLNKETDTGRTMIAQLLSGTLDWQLNPYANSNQRKVKITFVDQTGINQVSTEITVIMKASVKILNADNSLPQNNKASNSRVKLVINGTDLLANNKTSPLSFPKAYAAETMYLNSPSDGQRIYIDNTITFNFNDPQVSSRRIKFYTLNVDGKQIRGPLDGVSSFTMPASEIGLGNHTWNVNVTNNNSGLDTSNSFSFSIINRPTPTTKPTSIPTPSPTSTQASQPKDCNHGDIYNTCVPITTEKCSNNPTKREAFLYMCNEKGQLIQYGYDCIDVGSCSNNITTTSTTQPSPTPSRRTTTAPEVPNIPGGSGGGSSCPQSGDTCIYSESDGRCFSGTGATGFNVPGCNFSCGPIACPGGDDDNQPPLPPVGEPPTDTGDDNQPGTPDAPKTPTVIIRNADSGSGGSQEREIPLTAGDITIDDWILNTNGSSSLRTVQAAFKNADGETANVVNAFIHL